MNVERINDIRNELLDHPMYKQLTSMERIQVFMKHHSFAVWDFMSLLKRLQLSLTCTNIPWVPVDEPDYARFINEIVIGEETDEDGEGGFISHYELYVKSMNEVGAETNGISDYIERIKQGGDAIESLNHMDIPESVKQFVKHNIDLAQHGKLHEVAAAFFFGREGLIPDMFDRLLVEMKEKELTTVWLEYYLQRHIELDGDEHGILAEKLLISLCDNEQKIKEAEQIARVALNARIGLWNGVLKEIEEKGL
ncbi:DUF3050 domain-containing protein [Longirhabdus pacifica]|uniref:DUF3050 domain-containing protein n=1 Tax=Longirhabdus pacifica TaxID=2305227 RepID=UPI001008DDA0|nr:DUF3050 domain-containing protein [Longirhabdus pacifica]